MPEPQAVTKDEVLNRLSSLRQHRRKGQRSPHKPLLLLFAIGRLSTTGTSAIEWSAAESQLAELIQGGALGLDASMRINVSGHFYGRTDPGKAVYDLHRRALRPRPGTALPATEHVEWHWEEVFKSPALVA